MSQEALNNARDVLQFISTVMFVVLGVVAVWRWLGRRGPSRGWLAATFGSLGLVVGVSVFLPQEPAPGPAPLSTRLVIALIGLFPYFLFRFAATFRRPSRAMEVAAGTFTSATVVGQFAFSRFPGADEPQPEGFNIYTGLILVQWSLLLGFVAVDLWRSGRGQPTVSRRRMRLLAFGAFSLALALVASVATGAEAGATLTSITVQMLGIISAPFFLMGFAPPAFILASWRRPELLELRDAEAGLMQALTPAEVGERLVPRVSRIIGGSGAALFDEDHTLLQADGLGPGEPESLLAEAASEGSGATPSGNVVAVRLNAGWLLVKATPHMPYFAPEETELLHTLATFTDLALSRARLFERERETARELRIANDAMREFVAVASHDLRTPITVIKGFTQTLEMQWQDITDEQRTRFLGTIHRHADHLSAIVDDLLTSSRLDSGVIAPARHDVELRSFVERIVSDLNQQPDGDVPTEIDVADDVKVSADPEHLTRVLSNLLSNARRYGAPPFAIRATREPGSVVLRVCDNGPGLDPDFTDRAFEKFSRADKRRSKETQGTGLGLAIVRGLARAGGGDAWYEPVVPRGACFAVRLPG